MGRLESEIEILTKLDHPNIAKYFGTFVDDKEINIVMELCQGGELYSKIKSLNTMSEYMAARVI